MGLEYLLYVENISAMIFSDIKGSTYSLTNDVKIFHWPIYSYFVWLIIVGSYIPPTKFLNNIFQTTITYWHLVEFILHNYVDVFAVLNKWSNPVSKKVLL